jgi:hypothetical protein
VVQPSPYLAPVPGVESVRGAAPTGILLLRIYCALQVFLYLLLVGVGAFLIIASLADPASFPTSPGEPPPWIIGVVITVLYLPLLVVYAVGLAAPRRRWLYMYGIVVCALSMTCGGCWMFAIPTLIFWLKPETKAWLGA